MEAISAVEPAQNELVVVRRQIIQQTKSFAQQHSLKLNNLNDLNIDERYHEPSDAISFRFQLHAVHDRSVDVYLDVNFERLERFTNDQTGDVFERVQPRCKISFAAFSGSDVADVAEYIRELDLVCELGCEFDELPSILYMRFTKQEVQDRQKQFERDAAERKVKGYFAVNGMPKGMRVDSERDIINATYLPEGKYLVTDRWDRTFDVFVEKETITLRRLT